jgi:hypothetical protein
MQTRLKRACLPVAFAGVVTALLGGTLLGQSNDVGTWKIDVAKSKFSPGPTPKSGTTKIEAVGEGRRYIVDQSQVDGSSSHFEFTTNLDGKDSPATGNNPNADMVALTRINANTIQIVSKKSGKVTTTQTAVVSADGKTRTVTTKGADAAGRPVNNVMVFERE